MDQSTKAEPFTTVDEGSIEQFFHDVEVFVLGDYDLLPAGVGNGQFFGVLSLVLKRNRDFAGPTEIYTRRATAKLKKTC